MGITQPESAHHFVSKVEPAPGQATANALKARGQRIGLLKRTWNITTSKEAEVLISCILLLTPEPITKVLGLIGWLHALSRLFGKRKKST
jgi:hypothetical protein